MTHAFLVMAHSDPAMCARLVRAVAGAGPVHAHLDSRADPDAFAAAARHARFERHRIPVRWGGWSQVEVALRLARRALEDTDVEQVSLISGQHFPVVAPAVLAAACGQDRIALNPCPDAGVGKPESRFTDRYLALFPPDATASIVANGLLRRLPDLPYRKILAGRQLYGGSSWWSLSRGTLEQALGLLDDASRLRRYFQRIVSADESALHTAVGAVGPVPPASTQREQHGTTFVVWNGGRHPEPLTGTTVRLAATQGWWFARKFTSSQPELVDQAQALWDHREESGVADTR